MKILLVSEKEKEKRNWLAFSLVMVLNGVCPRKGDLKENNTPLYSMRGGETATTTN